MRLRRAAMAYEGMLCLSMIMCPEFECLSQYLWFRPGIGPVSVCCLVEGEGYVFSKLQV